MKYILMILMLVSSVYSLTVPYDYFLEDEEIVDFTIPIKIDTEDYFVMPPVPKPGYIYKYYKGEKVHSSGTLTYLDDPELEGHDIDWCVYTPQSIWESVKGYFGYLKNNYPYMAKRVRMNGKVYIKFIIDKEGKPCNLKIKYERPENMGFGEVAKEAVKKLKYSVFYDGKNPAYFSHGKVICFKAKEWFDGNRK